MRKLELEVQVLEHQVEEQKAQRDAAQTQAQAELERAQLELTKLKSEINIRQHKELELLTNEFWQQMDARVQLLTQQDDTVPGWRALREASRALAEREGFSSIQLSAMSLIHSFADDSARSNLSERDLFGALLTIERVEHDLTMYDYMPFERDLDDEEYLKLHNELHRLQTRLRQVKEQILRSSVQPGMRLWGLHLRHLDLHGMDLSRVTLARANLSDTNLQYANLESADLEKAHLIGAKLSGANLQQASLREANLNLAGFRDANLDGADLSRASLKGADLKGASLRSTIIAGAKYRAGTGDRDTEWPDGFDPKAAGAQPQKWW